MKNGGGGGIGREEMVFREQWCGGARCMEMGNDGVLDFPVVHCLKLVEIQITPPTRRPQRRCWKYM